MSKFITFDRDSQGRISCGVTDESCAVDVYPIAQQYDRESGRYIPIPTARHWPQMSILIRPGLTMLDVERNVMSLLDAVHSEYGRLERFAEAINIDREHDADAVYRARKRLNLVK